MGFQARENREDSYSIQYREILAKPRSFRAPVDMSCGRSLRRSSCYSESALQIRERWDGTLNRSKKLQSKDQKERKESKGDGSFEISELSLLRP